ncbi:MAG: bifunctional (p)ppGpp synthetase/guanosine-3',5'-bis(diphosphate) 3'-pyrophosphohydrolase [Proteobacteria bacterium]|nr:bifunctional (p)ppGpp synthetase/guanosine-3',5'-bis(diphosphate) 3'-pyrophosphohydrolase [Pseudomonadota bacterium]
MVTSELENLKKSSDEERLVAAAREFLDALPEQEQIRQQRAEGRAIADIVEGLGLSPDVIAAVHVYPLLRDDLLGSAKLEASDIGELAGIAHGLVQLGRFRLPPDWQPGEALAVQQSEALRKMLLAVVSDVRLVLVRIAEQLYRLRLAKKAPMDEQQALAIETREIYAALANRLGVWRLKWELEDLAFRYLEPVTYKQIAQSLNEKRTERESFIATVKSQLLVELAKAGLDADISGRPKHIYSIWRKMQRKGSGLEHIFDERAVRVLVNDVRECYAALGVVHNLWSYLPGEFDDYIANPKENNYQSLHTAVIGPEGRTVEVQIRTHDMHRQAELGVAAHWRYKEGSPPEAAFDQKIRFIRHILEPSDRDDELLDQIRDDVFEDRVYAVSPKGDVAEMPAGSTPLDFAYHVHTQVGHRCRGAKVNGRIVPLSYKVQNGDKIEIITASEAKPSRDWLNPQLGYLAATRSRAKVRSWFRQQDKEQNRRQGREMLERELARLNVRDIPANEIAKHLKFKDSAALCTALGAGDLSTAAIATALQNLRRDEYGEILKKPRQRKSKAAQRNKTSISGIGDLLSTFARCCRPVPPEHIAGYITQGRGVSIHRQDCGNFLRLNSRNPERVIEIDWGNSEHASYPAELKLYAYDRQGLLRDISSVLADEKISVLAMQTKSDKKRMQAIMELSIEVPGLPALSRIISRLEQVPNVTSVRRRN